jgi:hypothetical protein
MLSTRCGNCLPEAYALCGAVPTCLERDFNFPELEVLGREVEKIATLQAQYETHKNKIATGRRMNAQLPFQDFQFALARHLRHPRIVCRAPWCMPARRATDIYHGLVRNNLERIFAGLLPYYACRLLGVRRWQRLVDVFFREARCHTPYFREIPREFLHWLLRGAIATSYIS